MAKPKSMNLKNSTQRIEPHTTRPRDVSGGAMACTHTLPERTMPKVDGMECAADLTEEQHQPNPSAFETAPSPRLEAPSPT